MFSSAHLGFDVAWQATFPTLLGSRTSLYGMNALFYLPLGLTVHNRLPYNVDDFSLHKGSYMLYWATLWCGCLHHPTQALTPHAWVLSSSEVLLTSIWALTLCTTLDPLPCVNALLTLNRLQYPIFVHMPILLGPF